MEVGPSEREALANARSVWEVDENFTAPRLGFATVEQYYDNYSSKHFLGTNNVPTLIIHALDDPFVSHTTHFNYQWHRNPLLVPLVVECGGYNRFYGRGSLIPWPNRCAIEFLCPINT